MYYVIWDMKLEIWDWMLYNINITYIWYSMRIISYISWMLLDIWDMVWDIMDSVYIAYQKHDGIFEMNNIKYTWYMELSQVLTVRLNGGLYIISIWHMIYKGKFNKIITYEIDRCNICYAKYNRLEYMIVWHIAENMKKKN